MSIGNITLASKHGYYFVVEAETDRQYFLHASAVVYHTLLRVGDAISFDIDEHPQGRNQPRAINAVRIAATATKDGEPHDRLHAAQR